MQENRSFDSYFGTYPGRGRHPDGATACSTVCVAGPGAAGAPPYHDHADVNGGGPHGRATPSADVNGGKMNGFVAASAMPRGSAAAPTRTTRPAASAASPT